MTASPINAPAIIRHELGHSIIDVGEEYEGGYAYFGVNSAKTTRSVPWTQWYTDPPSEPKIQRTNMPIQAYPWTLLNTTQKWSDTFTSAGIYDTYLLQFSVRYYFASLFAPFRGILGVQVCLICHGTAYSCYTCKTPRPSILSTINGND